MIVFIPDSSLHDSADDEFFVHYSISSVRKNAWYMAGNEEIFVE